jgi:L-iditol 2-dehydrogenase
MKAARLYGVGDLRVEQVPKPQIRRGEALVKVGAATTCGTDLKILQRGYVAKVITLPTLFGHEWAGEVVEVGEGTTWPHVGMRIRAGNSAPCLRCTMCQRGKFNLCENMLWLWGAYAEFIRVPARTLVVNAQEVPSHVSYEEAALAEPLACVLHGAEKAGVKLADTVAIVGAGPIGLLHLLVAQKLGANRIIMTDLLEERLDYARKLGADETINAQRDDPVGTVKQLTGGYGADVVIEAIGLKATWEQALTMVSPGGTVLEFGGCPPGTRITADAEQLHYGEVAVMGAFHAPPTDFKRALNLVGSGAIDVKQLVTGRMALDRVTEAFEVLASTKAHIKIAIIP